MATTKANAEARGEEYYNEKVELMIPRDAANPKEEDASITVNGKMWLIKRGEVVEVPRFVYLAYMDSEKQKAHAYQIQVEREDRSQS